MSQKVRIEYFGMEGEGRNLTEARKDAGRKIEEALSGDYIPRLFHFRDETWLMWREPHLGYCYQALTGRIAGQVFSSGNYQTREECERYMSKHAAQNVCKIGEDSAVDLIVYREDRDSHMTWYLWQGRFTAWQETGLTMEEAKIKADFCPMPQAA